MLRRLSSILVLTAMVMTLLPTSNTLAQVDPGAPAHSPPTASPEYGIGTHMMGYPESTDRDVALVTGASFQWIKLTVPWRSV